MLSEDVVIDVGVVIDDFLGDVFASSDLILEMIFDLDAWLNLGGFGGSSELSEVLFDFLLLSILFGFLILGFLEVFLGLLLALNVFESIVLALLFPDLSVKPLEKVLAVERVVFDMVVDLGWLLVFIVKKVLAFGLASVNHVVFQLLLVHVHLLVLKVVVLLLVLVVLKNLLELLHVRCRF